MAVIVSRTNRTPGFAKLEYGNRTASGAVRPNMTSSFAYPKTNESLASISVTAGFFAELVGEDGRELEPAKPRAENDDPTHAASLLVGRNVPAN